MVFTLSGQNCVSDSEYLRGDGGEGKLAKSIAMLCVLAVFGRWGQVQGSGPRHRLSNL